MYVCAYHTHTHTYACLIGLDVGKKLKNMVSDLQ